ncbi:XRE family transcriptional regulator [Albitalea terrae]|uniref:XRE family transcriptional regulator n=2 Tax=Piscinibacter terrae TaxID=2496871 RepID=A0A3N7HRU2_9BURK|nr:XRE family transcriptional regulator [Albitalea terrae]
MRPMHTTPMSTPLPSFGHALRQWRGQRRLTQLDLSLQAGVSARHLSFVETGRASPSREMVLRLAHCLSVPMRERNAWLVAAGFAPMYRERSLDDPALADAMRSVQRLLDAQSPFPAMAMDRHWNVVASNVATQRVLSGGSPSLLASPNVMRLCHHPEGLAPRIANLSQVRENHALRLAQQLQASHDPVLADMLEELRRYPLPAARQTQRMDGEHTGIVAPFQLESDEGLLSFFTTSAVFGSVADITLSELAVESFLPADEATAQAVRRIVLED